jgi:hypothetical protein
MFLDLTIFKMNKLKLVDFVFVSNYILFYYTENVKDIK